LKAHKANKNIHRAAALCALEIEIINSNVEKAQPEKLQACLNVKICHSLKN
jgi:hypothetical protein